MSIKSSRHGGDVFGLSEEEQDKVFDFSININPLGLSLKGRAALLAHWEKETLRYPDGVPCAEEKPFHPLWDPGRVDGTRKWCDRAHVQTPRASSSEESDRSGTVLFGVPPFC